MPDHLSVRINDMLKNLSPTPSKPSTFRVDKLLRSINPEAYDPVIVAIGPFHHGDDKFQKMEEQKERYLRWLLDRKSEPGVGKYVTAIRELEEEARKFYPKDMGRLTHSQDEFVQMLILDGCFIIEYLLKFKHEVDPEEDDPIFRSCHIRSSVRLDLMVFENQIPFSIIKCLFKMISGEDIKILISPLLQNCIFTRQNLPEEIKIDGQHLLGIVHGMQCPSLSDEDCGYSYKMKNINSAVELEKAGISFKKLKMEDINSAAEHKDSVEAKKLKKEVMFHIEYGNKVMKIPEWRIDDSTESLLRNLIAYEYYLPHDCRRQKFDLNSQRYVTDYVCLMSRLVHSSEDAKLLRRRGIISHFLGSDEMVYDVINKLNKNTIYSHHFSYFTIFSQVNSHCDRQWNKWMAMLRRKYFNSPWAIISFFAAITLLLLAIIQTLCAILSLLS